MVQIKISDPVSKIKETLQIEKGTLLRTLAVKYSENRNLPILGAMYNNQVVDFDTEVLEDGDIDWLDMSSYYGMTIYKQTMIMLVAHVARELFPHWTLHVNQAFGQHCYCEFEGTEKPSIRTLELIEEQMRGMIVADEPIVRTILSAKEALPILVQGGFSEAASLLKELHMKKIRLYRMDNQVFHSFHILAPSAGSLRLFGLMPFESGFLIRFPDYKMPGVLAPLAEVPKLVSVVKETKHWTKTLNVYNALGLFKVVEQGPKSANQLIHVAEALQEKYIANLADKIYEDRDRLRVILIAGPSSSGKTTFCYRLAIQLRVLGLRPVTLSTDDYFVNRSETPRDENGGYDFESLKAIDIDLFNSNLQSLIDGKPIKAPCFDFKQGCRLEDAKVLKLEAGHPVIVEGIHALNEALTPSINRARKFKIYISSLVQIDIDSYNRVSTSDSRLLRRLVRDAHYRSKTAEDTLIQWPSVRRGEEKYIFPYQEDSDAMFNSALIYETSVFKKYATPLLQQVTPAIPQYADAQRLLHMLSYYPEIDDAAVPLNSILREFIGGSSIHDWVKSP